jgi:hypothetical protein
MPRLSFKAFASGFVFSLSMAWLGVILGDIVLLGFGSPLGSLAVHLLFMGLLLAVVAGLGLQGAAPPAGQATLRIEHEIAMFVVALLGVAVMFGLACRDLMVLAGGGFESTPPGLRRASWMAFGLDNLLECALLDIPSVYDARFVPIRASSFWSQTIVLGFRLLVQYALIRAVVLYVLNLKQRLVAGRAS